MKSFLSLLTILLAFTLSAYDFTPYKTIVCLGDSITHGGSYHMYLQEYFAETDPSHPRRFINRGISGDTSAGLLKRTGRMLEKDHPDLVLIMVGINDLNWFGSYKEKDMPYEEAIAKQPVFKKFEKNISGVLDILAKANVKAVIISTPPYNESANPEIKQAMKPNLNSSGVRNLVILEQNLAKEKNADFIDVYTPMLKNLQDNDAKFPRGKGDRIHPSKAEHLVLAQAIIGKEYTPGSKQKLAQSYCNAQQKLQGIELNCGRVPASCKTIDEKIAWYENWVSKLKGGDHAYWSKMLPSIIDTLKNYDATVQKYEKQRDDAWKAMYGIK